MHYIRGYYTLMNLLVSIEKWQRYRSLDVTRLHLCSLLIKWELIMIFHHNTKPGQSLHRMFSRRNSQTKNRPKNEMAAWRLSFAQFKSSFLRFCPYSHLPPYQSTQEQGTSSRILQQIWCGYRSGLLCCLFRSFLHCSSLGSILNVVCRLNITNTNLSHLAGRHRKAKVCLVSVIPRQ